LNITFLNITSSPLFSPNFGAHFSPALAIPRRWIAMPTNFPSTKKNLVGCCVHVKVTVWIFETTQQTLNPKEIHGMVEISRCADASSPKKAMVSDLNKKKL